MIEKQVIIKKPTNAGTSAGLSLNQYNQNQSKVLIIKHLQMYE